MKRIVPLLLRITRVCVVAPSGWNRTPFKQLAVGDSGRCEERVVARHEVVGGKDPGHVVAGVDRLLALVVVGGPEPPLDHAAEALDGDRGDDPLGGAADAEQQVDTGVLAAGHDRSGDVSVGDELDPCTCVADLLDEGVVAWPVEDADRDVLHLDLLGLGDPADVLLRRQADVDDVGRLGAGGELLHVEDRRRVEHRAALGDGDHRDRVVHALGGERGAVDRVDRDVDLGAGAVTDPLAVEEHRGVVLLALADDDGAVHADGVDERAHGLVRRRRRHRSCRRAPPSGRRQRRRLR